MSVLAVSEAMPTRLRIIYSYLFKLPAGEGLARLEQFVTPAGLRGNAGDGEEAGTTELLKKTLSQAKALGLVEEVEDKIRLLSQPDAAQKRAGPEACFMAAIDKRLITPEMDPTDPQREFPRAVAWLLMQSPLQPLRFSENYVPVLRRQFGEDTELYDLTNASRFQNLAYWARYLGYCVLIGDRAVVADPTAALARHLPDLFGDTVELTIDRFLQSLATRAPVFEGGVARVELEAKALPGFIREPQRLSQSTSLALRRLEDLGRVEIIERSDATARMLDLGHSTRRVSHIVLKKG